jgi:MerR family mercuric resistance operon transcriptional regulator
MRIGEVADALGLPTRTIRFYERRGLLPEPDRSANGYRVYHDATIERLRFIRSAQAAGLTLAEIGSVIDVRDGGIAPCEHVGDLLQAKLEDVETRQRELEALERELKSLLKRSRRLDPADCGARDVCHILKVSHE